MKEPKYLGTGDGKVVLVYDNIDESPIHRDTVLEDIGQLSDGYHTFDELYEFRKLYNATLFNEWAKLKSTKTTVDFLRNQNATAINDELLKELFPKYSVHKSWKHSDGELCFGGGWFIVSAMLPTGLISNHYKAEDWDLFQVPEVEQAIFEYDGHTADDVKDRLERLIKNDF